MRLQGRNLRAGMAGEDVTVLQEELAALGYRIPGDERDDGIFGMATAGAVAHFQKTHGLWDTAVVDTHTAGMIGRALGEASAETIVMRAVDPWSAPVSTRPPPASAGTPTWPAGLSDEQTETWLIPTVAEPVVEADPPQVADDPDATSANQTVEQTTTPPLVDAWASPFEPEEDRTLTHLTPVTAEEPTRASVAAEPIPPAVDEPTWPPIASPPAPDEPTAPLNSAADATAEWQPIEAPPTSETPPVDEPTLIRLIAQPAPPVDEPTLPRLAGQPALEDEPTLTRLTAQPAPPVDEPTLPRLVAQPMPPEGEPTLTRMPAVAPPVDEPTLPRLVARSTADTLRARAREIAADVLLPAALQVDRADRVPPSHLNLFADTGFYGVQDRRLAADLVETLASGCLTTTFVWLQHLSALRACAASDRPHPRALTPALARGEVRGGLALAGIRGENRLRVRAIAGAFRLDGTVPWVTGWGMVDVLQVAAVDEFDTVHFLLVDAKAGDTVTAEPLDLTAVRASRTVTLRFTGHEVPTERLLSTQPYAHWAAREASGSELNGFLAVGVADRCARLLGDGSFDHAVENARSKLRGSQAGNLPLARALASQVAMTAAAALIVHSGSRAVLADQQAQRLWREAGFLLVFGARPVIRTALLDRLRLP